MGDTSSSLVRDETTEVITEYDDGMEYTVQLPADEHSYDDVTDVERGVNNLGMSESAIPACATRRKGSMAHGDVHKYRVAFDAFDTENEGRLPCKDLQELANRLGYRITDETVTNILQNNELDIHGYFTFEEFLDLVPRNYTDITFEDHRLADLRSKFAQYDVHQKGTISLQEAQWALQMELKVQPVTAFRLLNQFIRLNYDQFTDFFAKIQEAKLTIYDKFGRYDQDQDGMVSIEEAHEVLHKELGFSPERSRAMVGRFDVNKDGLVSYMEFAEFYIAVEEKKAKIREAFRHFDKEHAGSVKNEHAAEIMQGMLGFSESRSQKALEIYDKNKDGRIDYEEFLEFYSMLEEERDRLLSEFNKYDEDQDGRISFDEFRNLLRSQGYKDEETEQLMSDYDLDHDGYLNFHEFKMFLNMRDT